MKKHCEIVGENLFKISVLDGSAEVESFFSLQDLLSLRVPAICDCGSDKPLEFVDGRFMCPDCDTVYQPDLYQCILDAYERLIPALVKSPRTVRQTAPSPSAENSSAPTQDSGSRRISAKVVRETEKAYQLQNLETQETFWAPKKAVTKIADNLFSVKAWVFKKKGA